MNHQNLKIGIVLPVYNTEKYLPECLNSILSQTHKNFMVFAVDDGSTDHSLTILHQYARHDPRLHVYSQKNSGVSAARNKALEELEKDASCDLVTFTDSDDLLSNDYLEYFAQTSSAHNAEYAICGWQAFDKSGPIRRNRNPLIPEQELSPEGAIHHAYNLFEWKNRRNFSQSYFITTRCFSAKRIKGLRFNTKLKIGEDQEFYVRALKSIKKGWFTNDIKYYYRIRSSSLCHKTNDTWESLKAYSYILRSDVPNNFKVALLIIAEKYWYRAWKLAIASDSLQHAHPYLTDLHQQIINTNKETKSLSITAIIHLFIYKYAKCLLKPILKIQRKKILNTPNQVNAFE